MLYCDNEIRRQLCREHAAELARDARRARAAFEAQAGRPKDRRARGLAAFFGQRRRQAAEGAAAYRT